MPSRFRRCLAVLAVWPALIGIATSAARGQTVEPSVEPSVEVPVAPSDAPPVPPTVQLSDASRASDALPPGPPPPRLVRRVRVGLVIGGAVLFLAAWVPAVLVSRGAGGCDDQACRDAIGGFWIPVFGPLLATDGSSLGTDLGVVWSLAEAGGIAMFIVGLVGHEVPVEPAKASWRITPTVSRGVAGLAFGATF